MKTFLLVLLLVIVNLAQAFQLGLDCSLLDNEGHIRVVNRSNPQANQCLIMQQQNFTKPNPNVTVGLLAIGNCNDTARVMSWAVQHKRGNKSEIVKLYWNKNLWSNTTASRDMKFCLSFNTSALALVKCKDLPNNLTLVFQNLTLQVKSNSVGGIITPFNSNYTFGSWFSSQPSNCCSIVNYTLTVESVLTINEGSTATYMNVTTNKTTLYSSCYLNQTTVKAAARKRRDAAPANTITKAPDTITTSTTQKPVTTPVPTPAANHTLNFDCLQQLQVVEKNLFYNLYWNAASPSVTMQNAHLLLVALVIPSLVSLLKLSV